MPALILSGILGWWISGHLQAADPQPATTPDSTVPAESPVADTKGDSVANSVVKIFSTLRRPDVYKPWLKQSPEDISGSGVVIKGNRILTNAHVVLYATQIQVQANQAGDKFFAQVEFVAPGIDLAVLKLDDERFFEGHPPLLPAHALPAIKDTVMTYGYPLGGDSLSITKGIVSRIEYGYLYNWPVLGLRIQVDAAINPGNSGGPVVSGNSMIGLAFSGYSPKQGVQNIGYVIPSEEIELFLQDIADGHYDGKPTIFDSWFYIQNPTMRDYLQMNKDQSGVMISKVYSSDPDYPLKVWDVISKIGDTPIDDQGKIKIGDDLRVDFRYYIQKITKDGKVPLTILRQGKEIPVMVPVTSMLSREFIVPPLYGGYPSYFIYGPLVFSNATTGYLNGYGNGDNAGSELKRFIYDASPLVRHADDKPDFPGQRLVVVSSQFFPHKLATGYSNPVCKVLQSVNGIPIKNLGHLVEVLRDCKDEFVVFSFDTRDMDKLVFRREEILAATPGILTDNSVVAQGSPDVLEIWNAKPSP